MANRGACYGIAAAVQCKLANKRDQELEQEILAWMSEILGERLPQGEFGEILRDGVVLCKLMNRIKPGIIPKINASGAPFKMMENIENFIKAAERYGVPKIDLFQTVDLWEKRNIPSVVQCIMAVGRNGYLHPDFQGPFLGPRPSEDYRREFNEQMLGTSF